jgi:chorismate mutase
MQIRGVTTVQENQQQAIFFYLEIQLYLSL